MADTTHWADEAAKRVIKEKGEKDVYTVASGITPSGTVHIGNFREMITVDLVAKALVKMGKKVRFIFSWDDYDVFRKVPANMPKKEMLEGYLKKPICSTPDPFEEHGSYAEHFEKEIEDMLPVVDVCPEFIYQSKKYMDSDYAEQIKTAMQKKEEIIKILNTYRSEPLKEGWVPISIFCEKCGSNDVIISSYDDEYSASYKCNDCGNENTVDFRKTACVKLLWRVDWPMRWSYEGVDFEPGGKDHSSEGGSFDTAKKIAGDVYGTDAPVYLMYDFVRIKGKGGKKSSSSGDVVTLKDVLEIYEPEIVRWIFASYRTNTEFAISFDLDVLKIYEDYDRMERQYYGVDEVSEKKKEKIKHIYEYSQIGEMQKEMPIQPSFRHLCNILQIHDFDHGATKEFYADDIKNEHDEKKLERRLSCAESWIKMYAPDDFKFILNKEKVQVDVSDTVKKAVAGLCVLIKEKFDELDEKSLYESTYDIIHAHNVEPKDFFSAVYRMLISKDNGPKLAGFMKIIGKERLLYLLNI
ncbi:lysine--tRNA ligase [Spirochaetota bacterium]